MSGRIGGYGGGLRLSAVPARVGAFVNRHPTGADTVMALVLLLLSTVGPGSRTWTHVLVCAGLSLPLALRRRAPVAVFAFTSLVALCQFLLDIQVGADFALLIAFYTVAAHRNQRWTLAAAGVLGFGSLCAAVRWTPDGGFPNAFVALFAMIVAAGVVGAGLRTRRDYLAAVEDRADRLEREQDQQARLAVAAERSRIAREMHDIVTHNLSVMVALADAAAMTVGNSPARATVAMEQVSGTGRQALVEMRRFLGVLREDEPDAARHPQPDLTRLGALADQVRAAGLPATLTLDGDTAAIPQGAQLAVYRLTQEALTNTLKHAFPGATARILVRCSADAVDLTVVDDGRARESAPGTGSGLTGMRERAAVYGGTVEAGPAPEGGWQVSAHLNLTDPATP